MTLRTPLRIAVVLITAAGWWITYSQTRNMGLLMSLGVPMSIGMEGWADPTSFVVFTAMWAVMMIAMMLPSSYPTLLMHRSAYLRRHPASIGGTFLFAASYFLAWTLCGTFFYLAYVLMGYGRTNFAISDVHILRAAGAGLVIAGIYQWTRMKLKCLKHCQNPLLFIAEHWHDGRTGALRMGAEHGLYCIGCCWGLMLVLFIMGVMHMGWMAAVGVFILLEKITPSTAWLPKAVGFVLIVLGGLIFMSPDMLADLSSHVIRL